MSTLTLHVQVNLQMKADKDLSKDYVTLCDISLCDGIGREFSLDCL